MWPKRVQIWCFRGKAVKNSVNYFVPNFSFLTPTGPEKSLWTDGLTQNGDCIVALRQLKIIFNISLSRKAKPILLKLTYSKQQWRLLTSHLTYYTES